MLKSLKNEVKEEISKSSSVVKELIKKKLVQTEISRRAGIFEKAVSLFTSLTSEGNKLKPDNCSYKEDHSLLSEGWSKPQLELKKKNKEAQGKLSKLIDAAMGEKSEIKDWDELSKSVEKALKAFNK